MMGRFVGSLLVTLLLSSINQISSEVVTLTDATFEHQTQASTGQTTGKWLIKFFAPWCGHCKRMAATYKELADLVEKEHAEEGIIIAEVDSTVHRQVTERFGVRGYPTLKFIAGGKVYQYKGNRSLDDMLEFCLGKYLDTTPEPVPAPPSFIDTQRKKWNKFVKNNEAIQSFSLDVEHILQFRKNAAAALVIVGVIFGALFGFILGSMKSTKRPKPQDKDKKE